MRMWRTICAGVLMGALLTPVAPAARTSACAEEENLAFENYDVKVRAQARSYSLGDAAIMLVRVTRKNTGDPVRGADIGVGIHNKSDGWTFGNRKSDSGGRAIIRVPLRRNALRPGWAVADTYAWGRILHTACATVTEYGYRQLRRAFRVRG